MCDRTLISTEALQKRKGSSCEVHIMRNMGKHALLEADNGKFRYEYSFQNTEAS